LSKKKLKSQNKLKRLFKNLNLKKNDRIILHSNISGLYQYENKINGNICDLFIKFILDFIGKDGTLLVPTYNYMFTKGEAYFRNKTKSEVGMLGNYLLKKYYKFRTFDPIFSHIVFGKLQQDLLKCDYRESFGQKSVFSKIKDHKFKILCFCCSTNSMTFIHYIEKRLNVNYRFNKIFKGTIENKNTVIKYFVGKKKINYSLKEKKILSLLNNKEFKSNNFGKYQCYSVETDYLFRKLKKKINDNEKYLII
jgi:aminoglycoside 3-N-acetyltransferase